MNKPTTTSLLRRRLNDRGRKLQDILRDEPGGTGLLLDAISAAYALALAEDEQGTYDARSNDGLALFLNVAAALDAPGVHLARALSETLAPIAEETQSRLEVERHDREEMERDRERALIAKGRARGFSAGYDSGYQEGYEAAGENAA